jgi:hypothetical protein
VGTLTWYVVDETCWTTRWPVTFSFAVERMFYNAQLSPDYNLFFVSTLSVASFVAAVPSF